ncbi:MAG: hypothetical protein LPK00_09835 [Bacillaceae bacterium]|nr:hypothetical protein [Bacillaceae bacterium]
MLAKIKKVKFNNNGKNPIYKALLECPEGNQLYVHFDYTRSKDKFWPLEVNYNGENKGAKLAWYTRKVEKTTVEAFLEDIAKKINKKYSNEM